MYDTTTEFIRLGFKDFKKLFDLSVLQKQNTPDSAFRGNYQMLSARQLDKNIDSLTKIKDSLSKKTNIALVNYLHFVNEPDSNWKAARKTTLPPNAALIPDSLAPQIKQRAISVASEIKNLLQFAPANLEEREKDIRFHKIEWHRKFSLSLACLVLFFIGAPLGSIIRKGGIGLPLVAAIIFFLIFHLLNMFGEKFVKDSIVAPVTGMWLAVIVLVPVGFFLTYKAMHDSQLFNKEYYYRIFNRIRPLLRKFKRDADLKT
jgi:lipopolysaccharide export system permease protein